MDPLQRNSGGRSFHGMLVPLLGLGSLILFLCEPASRWCEFDRARIADGQIWRLLTCHLTHYSASHALWSGLAFVVLGVTGERRNPTAAFFAIALASLAISLVIWLAMPAVEVYRGLSGIDSALFALLPVLVMKDIARGPLRIAFLVAAHGVFISKIAFEVHRGQSLFLNSREAFTVLPAAHVVGFAAGIAVGLGTLCVGWKRRLRLRGTPLERRCEAASG